MDHVIGRLDFLGRPDDYNTLLDHIPGGISVGYQIPRYTDRVYIARREGESLAECKARLEREDETNRRILLHVELSEREAMWGLS